MATETGYMVVRDDYSTFTDAAGVNPTSVPPGFYPSKDATPGNSIDDSFSFTIQLPDGSTQDVTEHYWYETWTDLVQACNAMVQHYLRVGSFRLVQVSYTNPDDTAVQGDEHLPNPLRHTAVGPAKQAVIRCDVVSEIDEATIRATATVL